MTQRAQDYSNHRRLPILHLSLLAVLLVELVWHFRHIYQGNLVEILGVAANLAVIGIWHAARRNAQIVQDRIIRLEMQVRLARLLPAERHGEIARLTLPQLVALRFAGDAELPALVQKTLAENLGRDAIKRLVTDWQPDWLRV